MTNIFVLSTVTGVLKDVQRGVTLVELLVVLVVITVALSIVGPSISNSYENWQLRTTGRQLLAMLRFASQNARGGVSSVVCYYKDGELIVARDGSVLKRLPVPGSVNVEPQAPGGAMFLQTGQMLAPHNFTLTNSHGRRMTIRSGPLFGQISLIEGAP